MVTSGTYVILIADLRVTFKGSLPGPMFLYFIARYLGCRTRLRPTNSSVGVIFDAQQNDHKTFSIFEIFQ